MLSGLLKHKCPGLADIEQCGYISEFEVRFKQIESTRGVCRVVSIPWNGKLTRLVFI